MVDSELYGIEEIAYDEVLLGQCAVALLDKTARDMYIRLRDNRRALVAYLRCLVFMDDNTQSRLLQLLVHAEDDEIEAITAIISNYSITLLKEPCRTSSQSVQHDLRPTRRTGIHEMVDAIGAIDGTHIPCVVIVEEQGKYIGRKGIPTQNIIAACDWDMCFTYVMAGWEGTAHDARLFDSALTRPDMKFPHPPQGKYYLLDAGYPTPRGYLGPYRSHRYHLPDFRRSSGFGNNNEIFNYYHSSLRTTIKRTFRVWKNRFTILRHMPSYPFVQQVHIVGATMAIHNFIRRKSVIDSDFRHFEDENMVNTIDDTDEPAFLSTIPSAISSIVSDREMNRV
ncbi:uncharacterized protein LOC129292401 [Prosopis cineraria]|uniref:uncharacterized protein LOC129292401 n=1 Tax=Prosopis cineraria TaxID=364024 RepID=UPI00240F878C|nr:uncharacterized protein LOC129292401 [Prosopis cineraria]